jgi:glycerol-3-phosphate O-acyltransferase/dihydroxyacetone phosphate acyltransferase
MIVENYRGDHFAFRNGIVLWLALAAVACLPAFIPAFAALLVAAILVAFWIFANISPKRLICTFLIAVLQIFFREMGARNQFKVPPQNVPCIFVIAPHANQFLDPFVVMHAVGRMDLCFLAAAKSMRLKLVGLLARLIESIPVERGGDLAFKGAGLVWISPEDPKTVIGRGTKFTTQLKARDDIYIGKLGPLRVASVFSDESLSLKDSAKLHSHEGEGAEEAMGEKALLGSEYLPFRVMPHVDQSAMFAAVHDALFAGKAVGIFPEGGSHDRPSLLPLKV